MKVLVHDVECLLNASMTQTFRRMVENGGTGAGDQNGGTGADLPAHVHHL